MRRAWDLYQRFWYGLVDFTRSPICWAILAYFALAVAVGTQGTCP